MSSPKPVADFPPYFLDKSFRCTVAEVLDRAELVSFDVFDTLLRRPFLEPSHLFDALGSETGSRAFGEERRHAEASARNRHPSARDVTLEQTYAHIDGDPARESAFETSCLYPRAELVTWASIARAKGKRVVAISDMYLGKGFVMSLLSRHKINVDDLIISSEDGVAKYDGSAFRLLSKRTGVAFDRMLHFGDNATSDFHVPRSLGVKSVLVADASPRGADAHHITRLIAALGSNGSHQGSTAGSVIRDSFIQGGPREFWGDIGRYVVAPLVLGYAQWVIREAAKGGHDRVAFVARDGKLPREAFTRLAPCPPAAPYVHLSRSVLLRAGLDLRSETVLYQLTSGIVAPVSDYVARIGEGTDALLARARAHFRGDPAVGRDISTRDLEGFFLDAQEYLSRIAQDARRLLRRYLEQNDLLRNPAKVAIIDVGWGGTAASVLSELFPEAKEWTWLYFGTRKEFAAKDTKHKAMFFDYGVPHAHMEMVFDCVEIVEFLFSAPEPSAVGLMETPEGVAPSFASVGAQWEGWAPRQEKIAQGFHETLPRFLRAAETAPHLVIDRATTATLINHIVRSGDREVIRGFGEIHHQLGFGASKFEPILSPVATRYWSNIWRLLKGRPVKLGTGHRYWKNQVAGQFLYPLEGGKRRLALYALRQYQRGGLIGGKRRR